MVLALIAFVGFSLFPLLSNIFKNNQVRSETAPAPAQPAPAPAPSSPPAPKQTDLEGQARGYELVLQREPDNQTALQGLLRTRLELRDIKGTIPPLEKLAKLNPDEPRYGVLLAQAKQYLGDVEGAAQIYRAILTSKPGSLEALQGLVNLLLGENRPEAAIGLLQDTLKTAAGANQVQPGSVDVPSVQLLLGDVYAQQKRFDEANAIYDELIKTKPDDFRPVLGKALVLKTQGKEGDAKSLFSKAVTLAPATYKDKIQQLASPKPAPAPAPAARTGSDSPPSN
ncbi:tetratricopeptide repeat protein [Kamptonema formosum]|uniref:tetratricopeptide repeat protein n=1 Tax=Kamptonema formosum TaxID=331992 RepID=UPI0005C50C65